ncbi:hypothetical protein [Streptomyces sp. NPDC051563]|uniref:hypothetical protein n=1 Tax=Streptomyces sp. NPDC051563 TaxID=3365659 RepID=UPI003795E026
MGAKLRSAARSLWKRFAEGLMWTGFAWNGMYPPHAWRESAAPTSDQPCLPALSEAELAQWAALVRQLQ